MYSVSVEVQSGMKEATSAEETADAEKWGKQGYGNDWGQAEESSLKPDPLGDHPPPPTICPCHEAYIIWRNGEIGCEQGLGFRRGR